MLRVMKSLLQKIPEDINSIQQLSDLNEFPGCSIWIALGVRYMLTIKPSISEFVLSSFQETLCLRQPSRNEQCQFLVVDRYLPGT